MKIIGKKSCGRAPIRPSCTIREDVVLSEDVFTHDPRHPNHPHHVFAVRLAKLLGEWITILYIVE